MKLAVFLAVVCLAVFSVESKPYRPYRFFSSGSPLGAEPFSFGPTATSFLSSPSSLSAATLSSFGPTATSFLSSPSSLSAATLSEPPPALPFGFGAASFSQPLAFAPSGSVLTVAPPPLGGLSFQ